MPKIDLRTTCPVCHSHNISLPIVDMPQVRCDDCFSGWHSRSFWYGLHHKHLVWIRYAHKGVEIGVLGVSHESLVEGIA